MHIYSILNEKEFYHQNIKVPYTSSFFKNYSANFRSLNFHVNFKISLSVFTKNPAQILTESLLNLQIIWRELIL